MSDFDCSHDAIAVDTGFAHAAFPRGRRNCGPELYVVELKLKAVARCAYHGNSLRACACARRAEPGLERRGLGGVFSDAVRHGLDGSSFVQEINMRSKKSPFIVQGQPLMKKSSLQM
jgi:hypothetical protein